MAGISSSCSPFLLSLLFVLYMGSYYVALAGLKTSKGLGLREETREHKHIADVVAFFGTICLVPEPKQQVY